MQFFVFVSIGINLTIQNLFRYFKKSTTGYSASGVWIREIDAKMFIDEVFWELWN